MLIGREAECARIERLLADASGGKSGALVLTGDAGIGKTALCAWAVERAGGMRVLRARGVEREADLPFAGLAELCAGEFDRFRLLPAPQADALEGALARRAAPPRDRFAIGAALLSMLALASEREPALVVVDDAHWLDASSTDPLLFAARRLRAERVALLIATRPGGAFDADKSGLVGMPLGGLDACAARALLHHAHADLATEVAGLLTDHAHGNPLALLEVPRLLSAAQRAGQQPVDEPLPAGPTLERALLQRVTRLPDRTQHALLVAAASGSEHVDPVVKALVALGLPMSALDAAEQTGAVSLGGGRLEFRHPLLRAAIYHGASGPARRAAHAALGRVTSGESRAWHLAQAAVGEDEAVAALLERVAREARERGAPAAAASAFERAARLSAPGERRLCRLTEAAREAHLVGRQAGALQLLDQALAGSPSALQRADIQHVRGRILVLQGRLETAYRLLASEAESVRAIDPDRAATMLAEACLDRLLSMDIVTATRLARESSAIAAHGSPDVQAFARVMLAAALLLSGERTDAGAILDGLLPLLRAADPLTEAGQLVSLAAQCYFWLERHDIAGELLAGLTTSARMASAPTALVLPLCCRAELDLRIGRWHVATAELEEAADLGEEVAESVFAAYAPECLARLAAASGNEERCRAHAQRALGLIDRHRNEIGRLYTHSVLGLLELGLGRPHAAIDHLDLARGVAERHGLSEPNVVHWQADLVEAYARAREPDAARTALADLERQASRTGGRWALGAAARCRGLLANDPDAEECFASALGEFESLPAPFEVARTHLCRGEWLRRTGRRSDARAALQLALEGFDHLGATPWCHRAQAELRATGAKPRRRRDDSDGDRLTPHELQVALTVAAGASNREAAASLFLSPKTIEFHLGNVYRKLGIRTRSELAVLAAKRGWLYEGRTSAETRSRGLSRAASER